jgi:hypothetical protein
VWRCIFVLTASAFLVYPATNAARAQSAVQHLSLCTGPDRDACNVNRRQFEIEYPRAYAGDYQARRNVAFCLHQGCNGAVRQNPTLACAWRMIILSSGSPRVNSGDISNARLECGSLDAVEKSVADQQAEEINRRIRR